MKKPSRKKKALNAMRILAYPHPLSTGKDRQEERKRGKV
jgi:hypothetical protein